MLDVWNLQWQNHNQLRTYPLNSLATQKSIDQAFSIPDDFIVGMKLSVSSGEQLNPAGFYISSLGYYEDSFSIKISYTSTTNIIDNDVSANSLDPIIAYINFQKSQLSGDYSMLKLVQAGSDYRLNGFICFGSLDGIAKQPIGTWKFNYSGGAIDPDVILTSIYVSPLIYYKDSEDLLHGPYYNMVFNTTGDLSIVPTTDEETNSTTFTFTLNNG